MKTIIALFIAAVFAEEEAAAETEAAAEPAAVDMSKDGIKLGATDTMLKFSGDKTAGYTFMGMKQKTNSWLGIAWGGSGEGNLDKADFLYIKATGDNIEVEDAWSAAAPAEWNADKRPKKDSVEGDNMGWAKEGDVTKDGEALTWSVKSTANAGKGEDVAVPCGTAAEGETAATMAAFQMEWFHNPSSNNFDEKWTAEGDIFVETDADCKVVWWSTGAKPAAEEVKTGAQALAAAATVAIAALYM